MPSMQGSMERPQAAQAPIAVAVCAMGGQGGGVLVNWIVDMAEQAGWVAQATSVPGVAQRTGATIYYLEIVPADPAGRRPILALMPTPGEVDIVLGSEFMEGGRAMLRGLVTPDRTTLIVSTHRNYAIEERIVPGDGRHDSGVVREAASYAARHCVAFDMEEAAAEAGSVISAVMFGALAASGALPFPREAFEDAIRRGGVGVGPSLTAFDLGRRRALEPEDGRGEETAEVPAALLPTGHAAFDALLDRARGLPEAAHAMLEAGLRRTVEYQDIAYGGEYLDRIEGILRAAPAGAPPALAVEAARQIAVAMAYDDVIRVADLKTRRSRFERIAGEMGVKDGQPLALTEFMHPRIEEVLGLLPAPLGRFLERTRLGARLLGPFLKTGWRVRTDRLRWFLMLSVVAGLWRFRRLSLRHRYERAHCDAWLALVRCALERDASFAVEILRCRRLVKGYSDTHARGVGKFDRVMGAVEALLAGTPADADRAAAWIRLLREDALKDPEGQALDMALARMDRAFGNAGV
ncbi:indolepyruvate oxidoreductase subunit beta family protein [Gluconacetobacter sp. Hr-1-5]|uniref:indolepyruvate oxidoreductase subunit beta family protein n=1 Tax=Gluconacetobacter sp. Hr-1-5 TaxID=3395370 RepID=UPI003B51F841